MGRNVKVDVPVTDRLVWSGPELAGMVGLHWDGFTKQDYFDPETGLLEMYPGVFIPSFRNHNRQAMFSAAVVRQILADLGRPLPTNTSSNNNGN